MPVDENVRRAYYKCIFPWDMIRTRLFRSGMDVGLMLDGGIWNRRCSGKGADEVHSRILALNPEEIHFGAVWKKPGQSTDASNFQWRPFVIDIDLPDYKQSARGGARYAYKPFRTLATPDRDPSSVDFRKSWVFIEIAVEIIDHVLRYNLGFEDNNWVFSGRKGVHCWVLDERACALTGGGRKALFDYLTFDGGFFNQTYEPVGAMTPQWAAAIKRKIFEASPYLKLCYKKIRPKMMALLEDQQLWDEAGMQVMPDEPTKKKLGHWYDYERVNYIRAVEFALKVALPRLDLHEAKHGQLAKIPFSVHSTTGKIVVPFDPMRVDMFDPALSPTVDDAIEYHDRMVKGASSMPEKNIGAYVRWFACGKRKRSV
jgi:DNA primase small subunit